MSMFTRRRLLGASAAASVPTRLCAQTAPSRRPQLAQGVQSGDLLPDGAVVWSRADRPSRMIVEYDTTERFADVKRIEGPMALEATDYTSKVRLRGIAPGQTVFYRVSYLDLGDLKTMSEPVSGRFRVPPSASNSVSFVWSGDTVGQGWGINPETGGMTIYESMRKLSPDFFVHSGDTIYADMPLKAERKLPDGTLWKNIVTEAKSKVAQTLAGYRGNHRYNFLDDNLRRFNAEVPMLPQWDDHEVVNNWYWEKRLDNDARYSERSVAVLAAYAQRAFREYMPLYGGLDLPMQLSRRFSFGSRLDLFRVDMRSYRGPNGDNKQARLDPDSAFMGSAQIEWLKGALKESKATWKIIAADMPLGVVVYNDARTKTGCEAVANGDDGPPLGRELEIADLLAFIKRENIRNVHWITADLHYAATHRYDPNHAQFAEFLPFYEFVSGPLCAGGFGPNLLDKTFGPSVVFQHVPPAGRSDLSPAEGSCHFGHVRIDGKSGAMTVSHRDATGTILHAIDLLPT
ncbi:MAG: alkaline phosphatase D family protein [Rhodospirillaceae bacterium]